MPRLVLSQSERLLLHLLEIDPFRDEMEVPLGASQEGVAQRLRTQVHNASRALTALQGEGLVLDRLAHVRGAQKRRKAYFLTAKGHAAADALVKDLMTRRVMLEDGGGSREVEFRELLGIAEDWGSPPSTFELAEAARSSETLSLSSLRSLLGKEGGKVSTRSQGRPRLDSFFGRDRERGELMASLRDPDKRVILITGLAGIGKSTLASWAFESNLGKTSQLWHTFHDWEGEHSLVGELCDLFSSAGAAELAIARREGGGIADLFAPLLRDLAATRPIVYLDDLHKARGAVLPFILMLMEAVRASEGSHLVLISRSIPPLFPVGRPDCVRIELSGLDEKATRGLAESIHLKDLETAVRESRGHPLLLHLMAASGVARAKGDVMAFLEQEICSSLSEGERGALEALSVYRHPVPSEALGDLQRASLPSLRAKGLVMEDEGGVWTHDLMVGFFLSRLGAERARETHAAAARYCASRQDLDWGMEALMHAVEADERGLARELVARDGEELALAFPQEAEALLLRMAEWKEMREQEQTLSALALAQEELGHDAQALGTYERLSGQLELAGDERLARALERKARLEAEMRRWAQAFDSHERALRLYQESKDATGEAREWLSLGSAYRRRGDYDKARDAFQKSRDLAEGIGDPAAEAAALNDLALVDWDEGGVLRAEELLELSVAKAHQAGDATGEGLALENLASLLRSQTREEQAQRRLEEAASAFRRAGDEGERKRAVASRAELLGIMGREDEAIALLKETIASEQARRGIRRIGRGAGPSKGEFGLRSALVRLQREAGSLEEAVTEAVQLERAATLMGDDRLLAKARIEMAAALEEMGRADEADEALQQARADLSRKGDAEGLAVVLMRRAALARRRGDNPISEEMLREALHQAKLSGSRFAEASVLEELGGSLEGEERRRLLHMALESYSQIRRKTDAERVRGMLEKVD